MVVRAGVPAVAVRRRRQLRRGPGAGGCSPTTGPTSTTTASCGPTPTTTAWSTTPTRRPARTSTATSTSTSPSRRSSRASTPVHVPPGRRERAAVLGPRSAPTGWRTGCSSACSTRPRTPAIPETNFKISHRLVQERRLDVGHHVAEQQGRTFTASIKVPTDAPYGMYSGAIVLKRGSDSMVVPVSVAVAAKATQDAAGKITGATHVRWAGRRRGAAEPALQQRLGVRRQRLGAGEPSPVTGDSSTRRARRHRPRARSS